MRRKEPVVALKKQNILTQDSEIECSVHSQILARFVRQIFFMTAILYSATFTYVECITKPSADLRQNLDRPTKRIVNNVHASIISSVVRGVILIRS